MRGIVKRKDTVSGPLKHVSSSPIWCIDSARWTRKGEWWPKSITAHSEMPINIYLKIGGWRWWRYLNGYGTCCGKPQSAALEIFQRRNPKSIPSPSVPNESNVCPCSRDAWAGLSQCAWGISMVAQRHTLRNGAVLTPCCRSISAQHRWWPCVPRKKDPIRRRPFWGLWQAICRATGKLVSDGQMSKPGSIKVVKALMYENQKRLFHLE